jgi:hypothetical protein
MLITLGINQNKGAEMGLFGSTYKLFAGKPEYNEFANATFKLFLLCFAQNSDMRPKTTLSQATQALTEHWNNRRLSSGLFSMDVQKDSIKQQIYGARKQIARQISVLGDYDEADIIDAASQAHKNNMVGVDGDNMIEQKVKLLEQAAILEVCREVGIDLFE